MRLTSVLNRVGLVTKAQADQRVANAASEAAGPSRSNQPLWQPFDANMRPGMWPYSILRAYADNCEPVRLCINRIKTMMQSIECRVEPVDVDHPDEQQIAEAEAWLSLDGGVGRPGTLLEEFVDELTEDLLVCGCNALYPRPSQGMAHGMGGKYASIEAIDAATIIPLRDGKGWVPEPPAPAYKQVLRGSSEPILFTRDELLYRIWGSRTWTPYGQSFVGDCMSSILQYNAADTYNLRWYTQGDQVLGYWQWTAGGNGLNEAAMPTPEQVAQFDAWQGRAERKAQAQGKPLSDMRPPPGWRYTSFQPRTEADYLETERRLYGRIAPFFGLSPSVLGVESDTYKADQAAQNEAAVANAVRPISKWIGGVLTTVLQGPLGLTGVKAEYEHEQTDMAAVARALKDIGPNTMAANERRAKLGMPPIKGGLADDLYEMTANGPMVIASTDPDKQVDILGGEYVASEDTSSEEDGLADEGAVAKAATDDLYRWRNRCRNAARKGRPLTGLRFASDVIDGETQTEIRKALESGADIEAVFAPYLQPERAWADELQTGLSGLLECLETAAEAE